jgi:hypothetical protein
LEVPALSVFKDRLALPVLMVLLAEQGSMDLKALPDQRVLEARQDSTESREMVVRLDQEESLVLPE